MTTNTNTNTKQVALLPDQVLSKTEEDILLEIYKNPAVVKHLQILALSSLTELASLNALEKDDSYLGKAHSLVCGKLVVLQTLLNIANIPLSNVDNQEQ